MSHLVQGTCELSQESRPLNQITCFIVPRLGLHKQDVTSETLVLAQVRQGRLLVNFTRFLVRKLP